MHGFLYELLVSFSLILRSLCYNLLEFCLYHSYKICDTIDLLLRFIQLNEKLFSTSFRVLFNLILDAFGA